MKLTNYMRDAFVAAAMNEVPAVDYDEMARKLAQADLVAQMPPKVRAVYNDTDLRGFLETQFVSLPGSLPNAYLYGCNLELGGEALVKLRELADKKAAQSEVLDGLRHRLKAVAYSCSTRKALADKLPEFEKYLPADEQTAIRQLPVVNNVVADFVKAGWPAISANN